MDILKLFKNSTEHVAILIKIEMNALLPANGHLSTSAYAILSQNQKGERGRDHGHMDIYKFFFITFLNGYQYLQTYKISRKSDKMRVAL